MSHEELPRSLLRHLRTQLEASSFGSASGRLLRFDAGSASTLALSKRLAKASLSNTAWSTTEIDRSGTVVVVVVAFMFAPPAAADR